MQEELEELEEEVQDRGVALANQDNRINNLQAEIHDSNSTKRLHLPHQPRMLTLPQTSTSLCPMYTSIGPWPGDHHIVFHSVS
jgi:hypothetical protein